MFICDMIVRKLNKSKHTKDNKAIMFKMNPNSST